MLSPLLAMQKCSFEVGVENVVFLALMPRDDMSLSHILEVINGYPLCDFISSEVFANFEPENYYHFRNYFPKLKRITLISEDRYVQCFLDGEAPESPPTEDDLMKPEEDIVLLSSISENQEISLQ